MWQVLGVKRAQTFLIACVIHSERHGYYVGVVLVGPEYGLEDRLGRATILSDYFTNQHLPYTGATPIRTLSTLRPKNVPGPMRRVPDRIVNRILRAFSCKVHWYECYSLECGMALVIPVS